MTDETFTPTVVATLPALPSHLDQMQLLQLAQEMARAIRPAQAVLDDYKLTEDQYAALMCTPFYRRVLETATREWNSAETTPQRVKLQAAALVEQTLPMLGARAADPKEDLGKAVEAAKFLGKIGQLDGSGPQVGTGEKFSITINIGDNKLQFEKAMTPTKQIDSPPLEITNAKKSD